MSAVKLKTDQDIVDSLNHTPNRNIETRFSLTRQLSSFFGPGPSTKNDSSPTDSNTSSWSGDSGFADKNVKDDEIITVSLSQAVLDLADNTWPVQESLMFR